MKCHCAMNLDSMYQSHLHTEGSEGTTGWADVDQIQITMPLVRGGKGDGGGGGGMGHPDQVY